MAETSPTTAAEAATGTSFEGGAELDGANAPTPEVTPVPDTDPHATQKTQQALTLLTQAHQMSSTSSWLTKTTGHRARWISVLSLVLLGVMSWTMSLSWFVAHSPTLVQDDRRQTVAVSQPDVHVTGWGLGHQEPPDGEDLVPMPGQLVGIDRVTVEPAAPMGLVLPAWFFALTALCTLAAAAFRSWPGVVGGVIVWALGASTLNSLLNTVTDPRYGGELIESEPGLVAFGASGAGLLIVHLLCTYAVMKSRRAEGMEALYAKHVHAQTKLAELKAARRLDPAGETSEKPRSRTSAFL